LGWSHDGVSQEVSGGSHIHTQLGPLFLLSIDSSHSLQGLQGEVQPPRRGVPAGRLDEEPGSEDGVRGISMVSAPVGRGLDKSPSLRLQDSAQLGNDLFPNRGAGYRKQCRQAGELGDANELEILRQSFLPKALDSTAVPWKHWIRFDLLALVDSVRWCAYSTLGDVLSLIVLWAPVVPSPT
jgi:hypothetical protein